MVPALFELLPIEVRQDAFLADLGGYLPRPLWPLDSAVAALDAIVELGDVPLGGDLWVRLADRVTPAYENWYIPSGTDSDGMRRVAVDFFENCAIPASVQHIRQNVAKSIGEALPKSEGHKDFYVSFTVRHGTL